MKATTSKKQCPNLLVQHKKSRVTFQGLCDHVHLEFNIGLYEAIYRISEYPLYTLIMRPLGQRIMRIHNRRIKK